MDPIRTAHLVLICAWGGLVLGELIVETAGNDEASLRHASRLHFFMDLLWELPLLLGVVATGTFLAWRAWPLAPLHFVKLALALTALAFNGVCIVLVFKRRNAVGDDVVRLSRWIRWTGIGVPFGVAAFVMGFAFFHR